VPANDAHCVFDGVLQINRQEDDDDNEEEEEEEEECRGVFKEPLLLRDEVMKSENMLLKMFELSF